jgi:hypothetical protein
VNEEWARWAQSVEERLADVQKFVNTRKNDLRIKGKADGFFDCVTDLATTFDDLAEMRIWTAIAKRFDLQAGEELAARYETVRKGLKDGKRPDIADIKPFADRAVEAIKSNMAMQYKGVWSASESYDLGNTCTHDGSLWVAKIQSRAVKPGSNACWQLCAKRGANGRDARA